MKKFMKFMPVALGMLMLASCSNDDFLGENTKTDIYANLGDGDMVVNTPKPLWGGDAVTRALRNFEPGEDIFYVFQRTDIIRVYDDALTKWDIYEYRQQDDQDPDSKLAFRRRHVSNLNTEATYALYPKEDVIDAKWEYTNEDLNQTHTVATVNIKPKMQYVAAYDRQTDPDNATPLYQDCLPLWGAVTSNDKGYVESSMEYLTGILCVQMAGVNEYAKWLRVQLIDKDGNALDIAGQAQVELAVNNVLKMAYEEDGETVIEGQTARITTNDFVKGAKQEIIVDMTKDVQLSKADRKHAKIFVPLACTDVDNTAVCIQVSYANTDKAPTVDDEWIPCWSQCNVVIERGRYYWNDPEINLAIDGTTPCAISDALELMAQEAEGKIVLSTTNPIMISSECKRIVVPNTEYPVVIDLSNGVYGETEGETLTIEYEDPDGTVFPAAVTLIADCANIDGTSTYNFTLDVNLPNSTFGLVDACPIGAVDVDANAFVVGDGETDTYLNGNSMVLSDNVQSLTIAEEAAVYLSNSSAYGSCALTIGETSGLEKININGAFYGYIDARTADVDITVEPGTSGQPAIFSGGARTLGEINAFTKAVLVDPTSMQSGDLINVPCIDIFGFAAKGDVTVTGQSIILGPVFSWEGDINITNENLNEVDYYLNGGKLSNLIYDEHIYSLVPIVSFDNIGYGPLYAEEGSVKIEATNSKVNILDKPKEETEVAMIQHMLNEKAQKAVTFAVYAAQDIDLQGEEITVKGKMWAENDIKLAGKTTTERGIYADRDFEITDESVSGWVFVGRNATVDVDEQDGNCKAISKLIFTANEAEGNALNLKQGYIAQIENGTEDAPVEVLLYFSEEPAYAAIGAVTAPDALVSQNKSIWNGKQMPANLLATYQNQTDIWTATQLAAQLQSKGNRTLRSDIDLNGEAWKGISSTGGSWKLEGNGHTISNVNLTGNGFVNKVLDLTVSDLTLSNVETNIPLATTSNVGSLAGEVTRDAKLSNVLVVLKKNANFGPIAQKAYNVGGVIGTAKNVDFKGVRINAQEATLNGYYNIGGFVGYVSGTVNIENGQNADGSVFKTNVNKLGAINVTYLDNRSSALKNDPFQGKTGLYIGSVNLDQEGVDGDPVTVIFINSSDDATKKFTLKGVYDESKAMVIEDLNSIYQFQRGEQTLIGNCGYDDPNKNEILINNKQYAVQKTDRDFKAGYSVFYKLVKDDYVDETGSSPYIDYKE